MTTSPMRDSGDSRSEAAKPADITSMALRALDDSDCVILARAGNPAALEEIVRRYTPRIYALQFRVLRTREAAEDATQETFMRACRNLTHFDPRRTFRAWLYAIAWNYARDELRRRKRHTAKPQAAGHRYGVGAAAPADGEPPDRRASSPSDLVERKEEDEWIHRALGEMRPQQRAVLVLREFEGLSYEDLAELFECRVGTIKSRINRARFELKTVLFKLRPDWFS